MRRTAGLTLIELVIVVAIILIIAAIAIPGYLSSKIEADEMAARAALRSINTAEAIYKSTYNHGYSATLEELGPPPSGSVNAAAAGLIDGALAAGSQKGYEFTYKAAPAGSSSIPAYSVTASPATPGVTGRNYYATDQSNVIRRSGSLPVSNSGAPAGS